MLCKLQAPAHTPPLLSCLPANSWTSPSTTIPLVRRDNLEEDMKLWRPRAPIPMAKFDELVDTWCVLRGVVPRL